MITKQEIDEGHAFAWGKTSPDMTSAFTTLFVR